MQQRANRMGRSAFSGIVPGPPPPRGESAVLKNAQFYGRFQWCQSRWMPVVIWPGRLAASGDGSVSRTAG